mmetsp:Transcript_63352/g.111920  ORF Transcript_63352/g.111920 Transcript_63352/m.111920 type:complete len:85 (-) Transcript_63352:59-313(-)
MPGGTPGKKGSRRSTRVKVPLSSEERVPACSLHCASALALSCQQGEFKKMESVLHVCLSADEQSSLGWVVGPGRGPILERVGDC